MVHELKVWPENFRAICDGRKRFEVRSVRSRHFDEGDRLILREWLPDEHCYTGQKIFAVVTMVHAGRGMAPSYVILGIRVAGLEGWDASQAQAQLERELDELRPLRFLLQAEKGDVLRQCVERIHELERDRAGLEGAVHLERQEHFRLCGELSKAERERDALRADRDRLQAERDALEQEISTLRESVQWLQGCPPEDKVSEELHHAAIADLRRWERTRRPGAVGNPVMQYEDFPAIHARRQGREEGKAERDMLRAEVQRLTSWKQESIDVQNGLQLQEIGHAIDAKLGTDIGPQVLPWILAKKAEVQRLTEEARRSDAGRVEVPEFPTPEQLRRAGYTRPGAKETQDYMNGWRSCWGLSQTLRLSPSPQPSADVVVPREEGQDVYLRQRAARLKLQLDALRLPPSPQPSADVVVVPREDADRIRDLMGKVFAPDRFHAHDVWALWKLLKHALRSSTNHDSKETP